MARTDEAELAIRLEAKVRDFERALQRAEGTANKSFARIEKDAEKSAKNLEGIFARAGQGMSAGLKAGLAGLAAGGIAGMAASLASVTRGIADIGSAAKRAGLDAKSFQELAYVAKVNRIEVDALTDGMKELSLRADEFLKTGAGGGAESFQRLGYSAVELAEKLKRPSDLFVEIIGRMERLDKAAQIRVADELFGGTGGERFVELLDRGADGVRTLIAEANEFGAVMSEEMIAKADEADRRFTALATTVSTNLKTAIVDVVDVWSEFFDGFKVMERQASSKVAAALQANMRERADLRATIDDFQERGVGEHMPMMINARRRLASTRGS